MTCSQNLDFWGESHWGESWDVRTFTRASFSAGAVGVLPRKSVGDDSQLSVFDLRPLISLAALFSSRCWWLVSVSQSSREIWGTTTGDSRVFKCCALVS